MLIERIRQLKREKNALVLCHNYQRREIYEVADAIGDSLELCKKAKDADSSLIVFCGVYFMAESAAILNPRSKVIIPSKEAGCALSDMITAKGLREKKKKHPDAKVVCYVNSSAEVKAESDVCCTSSNAEKIIRNIDSKEIIFVPDKNLADFIAKKVPEKKIIAWDGYCPIHERLSPEYLLKAKEYHPKAEIIAHPECTSGVRAVADYVVSTSGMLRVAKESKAKEFICTTECGMLQRMKAHLPEKQFYSVCSVCFDMKKITLEKIEESLLTEQFEVKLPKNIREKAAKAFNRMMKLEKEAG